MNENRKKIAFVTGGSRGIGRAIVEKLGSDGYCVGFNYINSKEAANEFLDTLKNRGIDAFAVKFDVKSFSQCEEAMKSVQEQYGSIDVLVNNAGITKDALFMRMDEDDFDSVIETNLKGVFNCTKNVVRSMRKQKYGRIINMSSIAALVGNIGQVNYSASKAALIGMTRSLAAELGGYNITVNAVAPGLIKTDMTDAIPEIEREKIVKQIPLKDIGQVEDIANAVSFLAGDTARYITGQTITVDGGLSVI